MFRNRHGHEELHKTIIDLSWHAKSREKAIATPFASTILDEWLLKEPYHVDHVPCSKYVEAFCIFGKSAEFIHISI
jgi:hypothetical protein